MLEIHNIDISNKLNIVKKRSKKSQIFLYDTGRRFDDFVSKLKYRKNGEYDDIPHFIITKTGIIHKVFNPEFSSTTFNDEINDKKFIKIAIENLGWLRKNTITGVLYNWIGDPYRLDAHIKSWRGYYYWDKYTEEQMLSIIKLCKELCLKYKIPYQTVPSQGYIENLTKFQGVVCKSNFQSIYSDINPSFDFKLFYDDAKKDR